MKSRTFEILKDLFYYINPFRDRTMTLKLFIQKVKTLIKERRLPRGFVKIFYKYDEIVLETSNICNARCIWCWMYTSGRKDMGLMTLENYKKFIDLNYKYLRKHHIKVNPYHRGEALLHPDFFKMLDYGKEKGVEYKEIHSNFSVKLDLEKLINSPLPKIVVNIGGTNKETHDKVMPGSEFMTVVNNLENILKIMNARSKIFLKMNVTKYNYTQISELPVFFARLGGDPENVIIGKLSFSLPAEATDKERDDFMKNAVSDEMKEFLKFTFDEQHNIKSKEPRCPYMIPTVKFDGRVTICCHDQLSRLDLGNAFETPLKEILAGKKYRTAENLGGKKQLPFCKECN